MGTHRISSSTVEAHLSEVVEGQTFYIIGFFSLPITFHSRDRSRISRNKAKVQLTIY